MDKKFKVSIEKQEDGSYIAYNTNMSGCTIIGTGDSVAAAKKTSWSLWLVWQMQNVSWVMRFRRLSLMSQTTSLICLRSLSIIR